MPLREACLVMHSHTHGNCLLSCIIFVYLQATLEPVSSSDKLELVDQLTDYVSDALADVNCENSVFSRYLVAAAGIRRF